MSKGNVLVVDDEEATRRTLAEILRLEGLRVTAEEDGASAVARLGEAEFDVIVLDLKMPGMDGLEIMRVANRMAPETQVILLTAHGSLESAIEALRRGASDYLLKPSSPRQIVRAVTRALEKRADLQQKHSILEQMEASIQQLKGGDAAALPGDAPVVLAQGLHVDMARREIWQGDKRVKLTPTEGKLFRVLLQHRNRVFTHRELVSLVQGYETTDWEAPEVLRPLVSRLRRKLSAFPDGEKLIVNVRGTGYVLEKRGRL